MSKRIESIFQINRETKEGRLLLFAIGRLMHHEKTSNPGDVLKILNEINDFVDKEESADEPNETNFPDDRENN
jgi:hypothetical protein